MTSLRAPKTLIKLTAVFCVAAVGLLLAFPVASAEERPARPAPIPPEQLKRVWRVEAVAAAIALKIGREDGGKVVQAYVSARESYAEKVGSLPRTRESFQQRRELAEKAAAGLKKALVEAVGAEKAEKILGILSPFGMTSFRLDRMVNDLIAFELPREKSRQAVLAVLEYNRDAGKAFTAAREAGSFEGVREKAQALNEGLNKELAKILSEEQMATWKEKQARPFGGRPRRQPQSGKATVQ